MSKHNSNYIYATSLIFLILAIIIVLYMTRKQSNILSLEYYPNITKIIDQKKIIINELKEFDKTNLWTLYSSGHDNETKKNNFDVNTYFTQNNNYLNVSKPTSKMFWIKLNKYIVDDNIFYNPVSSTMLLKLPNTLNVGYLAIEPGFKLDLSNTDLTNNIIRIYVPLLVPNGTSYISMFNNNLKINLPDVRDAFIISYSLPHSIINNTGSNVILLVVDAI